VATVMAVMVMILMVIQIRTVGHTVDGSVTARAITARVASCGRHRH